MFYEVFTPAAALKPYIESYVVFEDDGIFKATELTIVPSGNPEIAIHYGDAVDSYLNQKGEVKTGYLYGPHNKPGYFKSLGKIKCLCINFKPSGFSRIIGIPQLEMRNSAIELDLIFGLEGTNLIEQVCTSKSPVEMVETVNLFFKNVFLRSRDKTKCIAEPLNYIQRTSGTIKIKNICKELNINIKTLERDFKRKLGLTPKEYASIVRINSAYRLAANNKKPDIQGIISRCGYYDQAHFINEVKHYTNLTPQKLFSASSKHVIHVNRLYTWS